MSILNLSRVVKAILPGCEAAQTWYDRAGRVIFSQDGRLRAKGLHRFTLYDRAGRPCVQGTTASSTRSSAVNPVSLGRTASALGGYVAADPKRLVVRQLETVTYYDSYDFLALYGRNLSAEVAKAASAAGQVTGVWSRLSDGAEMLEVMFYDLAGRVTATRVFGPYGHESSSASTYAMTNDAPATVSYKEGVVDYTLTNSYTYANGAHYESTMSLNGSSRRLFRKGYDDLGRLVGRQMGDNDRIIRYAYDLMGRIRSIDYDKGFRQDIYYADGPGTPRYNGMVSAMSWRTGAGETRLRGYRYSYDALGRLTEALYGENTDLSSNPNRYTERVLEYTANGNVRRFQRHGLKDDGKYGKVDNLHLSYDGNQLVSVLDDAADVTRFASADFPDLSDSSKEYTYDECGALTSDLNHGISSISYDDLGNPRQTRFKSGATTLYVYTPDGRKVREIHNRIETIDRPSLGAVLGKTVSDTTDYIGPVIYEGRRASTVRFEGGYASFSPLAIAGSKPAPTFHYYIPDYLGNNRAVVNVSTGVMEQITHYYPWGGVYADLGTGASVQPFKYGDKELDLSNGIARYDYTARAYVPVTLRFDRIDPLAAKHPDQSPYIFCANNPVNNIDPDGMDWITAQYDDDYFYFWHPEIKCQDDISKYFYDNEGIEYLGSTVKLDLGESGVLLDANGDFKVNGIYQTEEVNSNGFHIGSM